MTVTKATTALLGAKNGIQKWMLSGDWFDVCKCSIPCPCTFAQAPTFGDCDDVLVWHIRQGLYGNTVLDGFNVLGLCSFTGNIWAGQAKDVTLGFYIDEKADQYQRQALQMIFSGRAGGFIAEFAKLMGESRGIEFAPIKFEVSDDLSYWSAEIPEKIIAKAEALAGPMTPPGKRVQTINAPGGSVGPGSTVTWGRAITDEVNAMGFKWEWNGRSSTYIPFDWNGP
jgi:hypothetical protein